MDLTKFFDREAIVPDLLGVKRDHAILELVKVLEDCGHVGSEHRDEVLLSLLKRERASSTVVGNGVAIPHIKTDFVREVHGAVGISREGVDFASPDGTEVNVIFLFLSPSWADQENLQLLALLARLIRNPDFLNRLKSAERAPEIHNLLVKADLYL